MPELRIRFEKLGKASYLSHLDILRTFQRAFLRAGVQLKHSEGFNPHPRISISQPLQLGCESTCETLDASVLSGPDDLKTALNASLPEGLRVLDVYPPENKPSLVRYALWRLNFESADVAARAHERLCQPGLVIEKKTKRGSSMLDLSDHMQVKTLDGSAVEVLLSANEPTINTGDVTKALNGPVPVKCRRLELYTQNMVEFR